MPGNHEDSVAGNLEAALDSCEDEEVGYHIRTALQLLAEGD